MKTAGIIGGSGYIGSYVTKRFLDAAYTVKISTRDISKKKNTGIWKNWRLLITSVFIR